MNKKVFRNVLLVILAVVLLGVAGSMDYDQAVIYEMPECVYDGIRAELGGDPSAGEVVDEYMENRAKWDSFAVKREMELWGE